MKDRPKLLFAFEEVNGITIVRLTTRLATGDILMKRLTEQLLDLVRVENRTRILLNFADVQHLSSSFLGNLLTLRGLCLGGGGNVILCNVKEDIWDVFEVITLDKLFRALPNEQEGLEAF